MKLSILHPPTNTSPVTSLAADYVAGVGIILVKNTKQFQLGKFVIVGGIGNEQTEIVRPTTITDPSTFTLAANTSFPHQADSDVTLLDFDQIKMYRSTTGINGSYTLFSTLPIDISEDFTTFEDTGAQTNYYYKFTYYNSYTQLETIQSDAISSIGFVFYSLKTMIDRVLSLFGDANSQFVTRDEVRDYLNEWYEIAQTELAVATKRFIVSTFTFTVQSGVESYNVLPANFLMEKAVRVSQDGGLSWKYRAVMQQIDRLGDIWQDNVIYGYTIYNNTVELDPIPMNSSDQLKIYFIPAPVSLNYQTDTLAFPFQTRTAMAIRFALAMCYLKDKKFDEYKDLRDDANLQLQAFLSYMKRLQNLHPQFVEILDNNVM